MTRELRQAGAFTRDSSPASRAWRCRSRLAACRVRHPRASDLDVLGASPLRFVGTKGMRAHFAGATAWRGTSDRGPRRAGTEPPGPTWWLADADPASVAAPMTSRREGSTAASGRGKGGGGRRPAPTSARRGLRAAGTLASAGTTVVSGRSVRRIKPAAAGQRDVIQSLTRNQDALRNHRDRRNNRRRAATARDEDQRHAAQRRACAKGPRASAGDVIVRRLTATDRRRLATGEEE